MTTSPYWVIYLSLAILIGVGGGWLAVGWGFLGLALAVLGASMRLYDILWHIWSKGR